MIVKNPVLRLLLFSAGWIFVGIGFVGIFTPLLPTTPFLLLAVWCFVRSSEKAHAWIYRQPVLAKLLNDWQLHGAISRKSKILATIMIALSLSGVWFTADSLWVLAGVTVFLLGVIIFILTRPEQS